jgi:hypothetical protein
LIIGNFLLPGLMPGSGFILYGSAFFAFATLFPKVEFLIFFILPVQVRFLALLQAILLVISMFGNPWLLPIFLLGYANYIFWAGIPALRGTARVIESAQRRKRFNAAKTSADDAFHTCETCKRTDISDPRLEFRVGRNGKEYCVDHLGEH